MSDPNQKDVCLNDVPSNRIMDEILRSKSKSQTIQKRNQPLFLRRLRNGITNYLGTSVRAKRFFYDGIQVKE